MKRHLWAKIALGVIILAVTGLTPAWANSLDVKRSLTSGNWCDKKMFDLYGSVCAHIPWSPSNINKAINESWVRLELVGDIVKIRLDVDHGESSMYTLKLDGLSLTGVRHDISSSPGRLPPAPANGRVSSDCKTITISHGGVLEGWKKVFKRVD